MNSRSIITRGILVAAGSLFLFAATPVIAITRVKAPPEVGQVIFQADFGLAGSYEDYTENPGLAWSLGATYHADRVLGIGVTFGHSNPERIEGPTNTFHGNFSYVTGTVQLRAPTRAGVIPRVLGGFGYYQFDLQLERNSDGRLIDRYDPGAFGMFFGIGVDVLVSPNVSFGLVGNYHFASIDDTTAPLTDGLGDWYDNWEIKGVLSFYAR